MLNISIVDDERIMRNFLKKVCNEYYNENEKVIKIDCFQNGTLLLESQNRYDLIFLDIELGIDNGIDIAHKLRKKDKQAQIVIVSGYEKYKKVAYSIHCFDYLDKPVTAEKIYNVLKEFDEYAIPEEEEFLIIKTLQGIKKIYLTALYYFEYRERKIFIYTNTGVFSLYGSLQEYYEKVKDKGFGYSHRAYVVNFRKINIIQGKDILLEDNTIVPLSKSKKHEFLNMFKIFQLEEVDALD